jgi:hypothetical protein
MVAFSYARPGLWVGIGAVVAVCGFIACSSSDEGADKQFVNVDPEPLFRALQDDLVYSCGGANGSCHVAGTYQGAPTWLADPDPYTSARRFRGVLPVTREVGDSILLTQVRHAGPALKDIKATDGKAPLYERVAEWLQAELPPPPLPNTGRFSVATGFNQVNLDPIEGLAGGRITFLATDLNGVLSLTALRFHAPQNKNVKMTSPFFVVLPRSGKVSADPVNNGFDGELTVPAGTSAEMYAGKMVLLRWDAAGQLKIVFKAISTTDGQGAAGGCTALELFKTKAIPAMQSQVQVIDTAEGDGGVPAGDAGTVIGQSSCLGCHGDSTDPVGYPEAVGAMDLRGFDADPAKACAQARNWINFQNRAESTLLTNPTGKANPNHPIKPLAAGDPILTGLTEWVNAEQP